MTTLNAAYDSPSKRRIQARLRPFARRLAAIGVSANQVTLTTIVVSIAAGAAGLVFAGALWPLLLIPAALLVRLVCNHVDGLLAREHGMATPLGGVLNDLSDVIADLALYLPLAVAPGVDPALALPAIVLGPIAEATGLAAASQGLPRGHDGPLAKKPRGVLFGVLALALGLGAPAGLWLDATLALAAALLVVTILNRLGTALGWER
jgi:CDP-diacylglycerol--glycerol-3-phosphate 3-phosphatidyltransferase